MKKIAGMIMMTSPFVALFIFAVHAMGLVNMLAICGLVIVMGALVIGGAELYYST